MAKRIGLNSKPNDDDKEEQKRYNLDEDENITSYDEIVKTLDEKIAEFKTLDEENPLERARKFQTVKENPPEPGYMKVEVLEKDGNLVSRSKTEDGETKEIDENLFFQVDPNLLYTSNIAAAPINAVSNLLELKAQQVREERRIFKREKREKEFPWGWVIIGLSVVPAIVFFIFYFL